MKDINLIPPDTLRAREAARRLRLWIAVNLAVVGILALTTGIASWVAGTEKVAAWTLGGRMSELDGLTLELEQLRAERSLLGKEERALASLVDRAPDHSLVTSIAETVAHKGWLSRIEMVRPISDEKRDADAGVLLLEGRAGSYAHLAHLMKDLDSLEFIAGVDLKRSESAPAGELGGIRFELECALVAGL